MSTTVYFVTNRNPITTGIPNNFGTDTNRSANPLRFGRATFKSIKDEQDLRESNLTIDEIGTDDFTSAVKDEIVHGPSRLMLHVHGFDYRFREALARSATFKEFLRQGEYGTPTTLILFSWPSLGSLSTAGYRQDVVVAKQTGPAFVLLLSRLVPLLKVFRSAKPKGVVAVSAHSLGNLVLTVGISSAIGAGIGQFDPTGKPPLFDIAQLFAADTDADALSNPSKLGRLGEVSARVLNYYNEQDLPLRTVSRWVHGEPRLGFNGALNMPSFKGRPYEFVNCSAAIKKVRPRFSRRDDEGDALDWQRHQYYYLVDEVRDDVCGVLAGMPATELPHRKYRPKGNYFRLDLAR